MCFSTPKVTQPPAPPVTATAETANNSAAANREAERRRRRFALSRLSTQGNGAMQPGPGALDPVKKTKLGE